MSNIKFLLYGAVCALSLLGGHLSAIAAEPVFFNHSPSRAQSLAIKNYFGDDYLDKNSLAAVDLNNDGLQDFISKSNTCDKTIYSRQPLCNYTLFAIIDLQIIPLGSFQARSFTLSNNFFKGIRDLHVYNMNENDYDYTILRWNPEKSEFRLIANGS
ncbi:MAG: hypothetical protein ACLFR0_06980 [Alphaproteobacteria bacterium]